MISKDTYLYNSDPLIGQWNKMQNITNIQRQTRVYFWTFFFYTYMYTLLSVLKTLGVLIYIIHEAAGLEP